ncbi:hypothetical protein [Halorientalis regularis]|uniref:hypothetical protein n=1 Tax=Halorientalis regularis TaxID=660518 RepID=UPI000A679329|nr:hypothetical protein [Halorientalis regularis]
MTFSVSTTLEVGVDDSSLRSTRSQIEGELSDIQVGVDGGSVSSQLSRAVPDGGTAAAGGSAIADKLDKQTEVLTEVRDTIEQSAVSAGGGGGVLGGLLPTGGGSGGGGGGFLSGLLTGGLALKAKEVLSVGGRLSLSAPQVLAVGGVLTLTAAGVLAVQGHFEKPARELLAVGGVLSIGAAGVLAVTGALSLPAAAVIGVTGAITLGVSEIVRLLPDGPSSVKTDGVRGSTKPGATPAGDGTDIQGDTVVGFNKTTDRIANMFGIDISQDTGQTSQVQQKFNAAAERRRQKVVVEVNENRDITVDINQNIKEALRQAGFNPREYEEIVKEFRRLRQGR